MHAREQRVSVFETSVIVVLFMAGGGGSGLTMTNSPDLRRQGDKFFKTCQEIQRGW